MKISRGIPVRSRIITETDLVRFLSIFQTEYDSLSRMSKHISMRLNARFEDNTAIEADSSREFLASGLLKTKRAVSMDLSLTDYENKNSIGLSLSHGDSDYGNSISVQSESENWVSALSTRLKESVDACTPQKSFLLKHKRLLEFVVALSIGRVYLWLLDLLFPLLQIRPIENPPEWVLSIRSFFVGHPFISILFYYALMFANGWFPSIWLLSKANKLWPSIEFQIGPQHTHIEKNRRKLISAIFTLGILPLLVSLIYDVIKSIK